GSPNTDKLEDDRGYGQHILAKHGVKILYAKECKTFEEGKELLRTRPGRYVLKPCGETANQKELLYIGKDPKGKDMLITLERYQKQYQPFTYQLQEYVEGIEIGIGAFFNGTTFVTPHCICFEHKPLFTDNLGPLTGEMGSAMFWSMPTVFFDTVLKPLESFLAKEHYHGYADINCIVNEDGIFPLEFTMRFGYPTIGIQQEGITIPMGKLLATLANETCTNITVRKGYQVGIRLFAPPFPYNDQEIFEASVKGRPITIVPDRTKNDPLAGIHFDEVKKHMNQYVITGTSGLVALACGHGITMEAARQMALERASRIIFDHQYYRKDIGCGWYEYKEKLLQWGYLTYSQEKS
ncbi:MAG: phosphoribosylamine--glycine ligase, partial [Candidatus Woesearchaeota archaeon]